MPREGFKFGDGPVAMATDYLVNNAVTSLQKGRLFNASRPRHWIFHIEVENTLYEGAYMLAVAVGEFLYKLVVQFHF